MDLSPINNSLNNISKKIDNYLNNKVDVISADFNQQQDIKYISDNYNKAVQDYSDLLKLITTSKSLDDAIEDGIKTAVSTFIALFLNK